MKSFCNFTPIDGYPLTSRTNMTNSGTASQKRRPSVVPKKVLKKKTDPSGNEVLSLVPVPKSTQKIVVKEPTKVAKKATPKKKRKYTKTIKHTKISRTKISYTKSSGKYTKKIVHKKASNRKGKAGSKRKSSVIHSKRQPKRVRAIAPPKSDVPLTKELKRMIPKEALNFFAWRDDDEYVVKILTKRGWTYCGEPVERGREDYPDSLILAKENGDFNKDLRGGPCLYWADDGDSRVLAGVNEKHLISSICNADKSLTKVKQQGMFNEMPWFPKCFTLPKQRDEMRCYLHELEEKEEQNYWICKPRDSYGGFGMCVFKGSSEAFMKQLERKTTFVIQRYMHNPYLFAGLYKFHFRCYMVVTNVSPLRSYLWRNYQIQFCTHKFDLNQIEKGFNKYSHITNYKVNNEKKNRQKLCEDKPGIGMGSEWSMESFVKYMEANEPRFSVEKFWTDLEKIARVVSFKLMNSRPVQRGLLQRKNKGWGAHTSSHFEIYGLDVLIDENLELALTEANTQPGLDFTDPVMPNGIYNPEIVKANDVTEGIVNDCLTLIGIDGSTEPLTSPFIQLHPVESD